MPKTESEKSERKRGHPSSDASAEFQEQKKHKLKPSKAVEHSSSDEDTDIDEKIDSAIKNFLDSKSFHSVVTTAMKDFGVKLKNDLKSQFANKDEVKALSLKVDEYEKERNADRQRIVNLEKRIEGYKQEGERLEMYGRRNGVRIFGIADEKGENTNRKALEIFNTKMGLNLNERDIGRSHRVGQDKDGTSATNQATSTTNKPRAILVKLVRHDVKDVIIKNRKFLKASGVVIVEDLTKYRRTLLWQALQIEGVQQCWSTDGRLYVKKWSVPNDRDSGIIRRISSTHDLEKIKAIPKPSS